MINAQDPGGNSQDLKKEPQEHTETRGTYVTGVDADLQLWSK